MGSGYLQSSLFGDEPYEPEKPSDDVYREKRLLVTVKAAPNPSQVHGETVCVAGVEVDNASARRRWIRLYPINFRHLESTAQFTKYDIITVDCRPARNDPRKESWKPNMESLIRVGRLDQWRDRDPWLESLMTDDMCGLRQAAELSPRAPSLGLVRATDIDDFLVEDHEGWSVGEKAKIDAYVNQLDLFDAVDKTPLEAPRFKGFYRWRCGNRTCNGHRQMIIDWEFVAWQRRMPRDRDGARARTRERWLNEVCGQGRDIAFYVGNQAKRSQTFSILGVYWPPK